MENFDSFSLRHIGLSQTDIDLLLDQLGYKDLEEFSKSVLPKNIFIKEKLGLSDAMSEDCLLYTSPSPRDQRGSRMPSSA